MPPNAVELCLSLRLIGYASVRMRRIVRYLLRGLALLSLLGCGGAVALWVRSAASPVGPNGIDGEWYGVEWRGRAGGVFSRKEGLCFIAAWPAPGSPPGQFAEGFTPRWGVRDRDGLLFYRGAIFFSLDLPVNPTPTIGPIKLGRHDSYNETWMRFSSNGPTPTTPITAMRILAMPHWFAVVAAGLLPTIVTLRWIVARFKRRRASAGGAVPCAGCGYDLRATPGRCPECGREADRARNMKT